MLGKTQATTPQGLNGLTVTIECDSSKGLPGIIIVGLGSKSVDESKERIRSAFRNTKLELPPRKFTINLAPANIPKDGTRFDLAMCVAMLISTKQIAPSKLEKSYFIGEIGLSGKLRPVQGLLASLMHLRSSGDDISFYVPAANAAEATLIKGAVVYPISSLRELYDHLTGSVPITPYKGKHIQNTDEYPINFDDVAAQDTATYYCALCFHRTLNCTSTCVVIQLQSQRVP